ncbi:MAG: hypothetical protein ACRDTE_29335 [Pseudonocardiaceae bacterium]
MTELAAAVRELAEANGGPPSRYLLKQQLGIGSSPASRLLAELDTSTTRPEIRPTSEPPTRTTAGSPPRNLVGAPLTEV